MSFPVHTVSKPSVLDGQPNGKLPDRILLDTPGQAGGSTVRLVEPAARAWRALCAAALKDGHILKATSAMDSYRPYEEQLRIFRERYSTSYRSGTTPKHWQGHTYYLKKGYATAAVPGTSNHGFGLAVDTGEERDGDPGAEALDNPTLQWLLAHADKFGFSWEVQSEPWHIRYYAGDKLPSAVLLYEDDLKKHPQNQEDDSDMIPSFDKSPEDVARATVRELCNTHWGYNKMTVEDQNWLVGEWLKGGRESMMTKLLDHAKAKKA